MDDIARKHLTSMGALGLVIGSGLLSTWGASIEAVEIDEATGVWYQPPESFVELASALTFAAPVVAVVVFVAALVSRRWILAVVTFIVGGMATWVTIGLSFFGSTSGVGTVTVTAADGHEYVVLATGFQDYIYQLGRVESRADGTTIQALAETNDFAAPTIRLVRPVGAPKASKGLRMSADGRYVVIEIWDGCASLILDTATKELWGPGEDVQPIESASPFILLGPDDTPNPADVERLRSDDPGRCRESKALHELNRKFRKHPNPAVQALFVRP